MEFFPYCLFVSNSQVIGCEYHLRNDLYCVGWGIKLYSIKQSINDDRTSEDLNYLTFDYLQWLCSFQNLTNLDRSRFVRCDRSSQLKKNAQIFLVIVVVVILFLSVQSTPDHALF